MMKRTSSGYYITISTVGETVKAFVPAAIPPNPPIEWSANLLRLFEEAQHALGKLDGISDLLPETALFLYSYVRKEAVLSSMIEGTQSSLSDLLTYELDQKPGVPLADVREVSRCVAALNHGLARLAEGFPLSLRLIREMHEILLSEGRGSTQTSGEFRRSQNWIGGTRPSNAVFVPPPPDLVLECMGQLEKFLHEKNIPPLLLAALAHVQFETIHPFLDGNGRIGRLLITLLFCEKKLLTEPLLYLSLYFKTHRARYYELLGKVRTDGDWESWLEFFAEAVRDTALDTIQKTRTLHTMLQENIAKISSIGRAAKSVLTVHEAMFRRPISTPKSLVETTGMTPATVNKSLVLLVQLGIVEKLTHKQRDRLFGYARYIETLNDESKSRAYEL